MESHSHGCDAVFASIGYNTTTMGDCSYFRIRDFATGVILANVSGSLGYGTFRLNFHRFDRFELDLRGRTQP